MNKLILKDGKIDYNFDTGHTEIEWEDEYQIECDMPRINHRYKKCNASDWSKVGATFEEEHEPSIPVSNEIKWHSQKDKEERGSKESSWICANPAILNEFNRGLIKEARGTGKSYFLKKFIDEWIDSNKRITATVTREMLGRTITVTVITMGTELFAGYSVCSPMDKFDADKAKDISTGRAMKRTTNLLQGDTIGSMRGKHLNRAIAFDILNKIEKGKIVIKGIRDANTTTQGATTEACKTTQRK